MMSIEISRLYRGILSGVIVAFLHTLVADGLIATVLTGRFFYNYGGNILWVMISETTQNMILGAILGAMGAYIAIQTK